jgi:hypothetical protein
MECDVMCPHNAPVMGKVRLRRCIAFPWVCTPFPWVYIASAWMCTAAHRVYVWLAPRIWPCFFHLGCYLPRRLHVTGMSSNDTESGASDDRIVVDSRRYGCCWCVRRCSYHRMRV